MSFSDYLASGGKVLNESNEVRDFNEYLEKKRSEFGDKFDASDLSKQFIPFYENRRRIEVDVHGEGVKRGRVGVTTGWKPVFLLVPTTRSSGSSTTLSDKDKLIRVVSEEVDPKHAPDGKKRWHRIDNIGKAKYTINFHDGVKTHPDGSKFYDMRIFKNKPDMEKFIYELTMQGYREAKSPLYEADNKNLADWLVRCYDKNDKIVDSFVISDRTEHEASREAESDPRVLDSVDWTMTKKEMNESRLYEAAGELFVVHGGFLGRPKAALSKAMSREEAESFADDLHGRKHLGLRDISIEPATDKDEVWNSSEAKKYSPHYEKMTKHLKTRGGELDEAVTSGSISGMRAVRQDLGLEETDTSRDEEIRAMSFKEYLGHYLSWEGIIGYTSTISAIADALHDKK